MKKLFLDKFLKFGESILKKKKNSVDQNNVAKENESLINNTDDELLLHGIDGMNTDIPTEIHQDVNPDDVSLDELEDLNEIFEKLDTNENVLKNISMKLSDSSTFEEFEEDIEAILKNEIKDIDIDEGNSDSLNFINNISVYDSEVSNQEGVLEEETGKDNKQKKKKDKTIITKLKLNMFHVIIGSLVVIIIVASVSIMTLTKKTKENLNTNGTAITRKNTSASSNDYIYVNIAKEFNGTILEVKKFLLDELCTVLYFNKSIDLNKTNINIIDNNNKVYYLDLTSNFNATESKIFQLQPLDDGITSFTVILTDIDTEKTLEFKFDLGKALVKLSPLYINDKYEVSIPQSDSILTIENSVFSSYTSIINYKIENKNPKKTLKIGTQNDLDNITLKEGATPVLRREDSSKQYNFEYEKTILGKVEFSALKNFSSKAIIVFEKVYSEINVSQEIDPSKLFFDRIDSQHIIKIDNYNIVLERMGNRTDKFILVAHGEDNTLFNNSGKAEENLSNRKEIQLDVDLIIPTKVLDEEKTVKIKGISRSGPDGSDIVFDTADIEGIQSIQENNYKLIINSVSIAEEPIVVEIDLNKSNTNKLKEIKDINNFIIKSFEDRLLYKASKLQKNELTGFSKTVLENKQLISDYTPKIFSDNINSSIKVISTSFSGDKILSVVSEVLLDENNNIELNRKHKLVLEYKNNDYKILTDNIEP